MMRKRLFLASFVVLLGTVALSTSAVFAADMFSGTWKQNIAKSAYSPGPPPKGPNTAQFQTADNGMKVVLDGVNASGQKTHTEYTVKFDGKDYPSKSTLDGKPNPSAADMVSAKKIDDYTVEFTAKSKGAVVQQTRLVVSKDGKTQTATQTGTNAQGQPVKNVIIVEKQ